MNKPRTIEGQWWIHGDDKAAYFGIFSFDPEGGLNLTVKIPQSRTCDAAWLSVFKEFGKTDKVFNVIHGTDQNNRSVTLFGCGCWETSAPAGLDIYRLGNIQAGILNFRGNSWNEARFQVARANYTLLTRWMNRRLDLDSKVDDDVVCLKYKSREQFEFDLRLRVRLRIEGTTLRCRDKNELRLGWIHCAWFLFSESLPAKTIHDDYAQVLLRLLGLLTGESEESRRKAAKGLELRRIMFALEDLLRICLLNELGIQGKPIERILERNSSVTYPDCEPDPIN